MLKTRACSLAWSSGPGRTGGVRTVAGGRSPLRLIFHPGSMKTKTHDSVWHHVCAVSMSEKMNVAKILILVRRLIESQPPKKRTPWSRPYQTRNLGVLARPKVPRTTPMTKVLNTFGGQSIASCRDVVASRRVCVVALVTSVDSGPYSTIVAFGCCSTAHGGGGLNIGAAAVHRTGAVVQ